MEKMAEEVAPPPPPPQQQQQQQQDEEGNIQCTAHPYTTNSSNNGGICAFCLQEKLGKLVLSSLSTAVFPSSSSSYSSTPSFRSDLAIPTGLPIRPAIATATSSASSIGSLHDQYNGSRRPRLASILVQKKKKKTTTSKDPIAASTSAAANHGGAATFKRSKSTATPRRGGANFTDQDDANLFSPRRRRFWSFLHLSKPSHGGKISDKPFRANTLAPITNATTGPSSTVETENARSRERRKEVNAAAAVVMEENESPNVVDRKVSRSRSVGCGSRSFSGDIFGKISTGLGDCTLRRVESQREGKPKVAGAAVRGGGGGGGHDSMKERVKCGGIFGGFAVTSSSSSSSSSSNWVSSSAEDNNVNGRKAAVAAPAAAAAHGRNSKSSWGWAFASPMRAFGKTTTTTTSSSGGKREDSNKNTKPNLAAIPSLLSARG